MQERTVFEELHRCNQEKRKERRKEWRKNSENFTQWKN